MVLRLSFDQTKELSQLFAQLHAASTSQEARAAVGHALLKITRSDYFASFVWSEHSAAFRDCVQIGMSLDNLSRYDAYFQYRDPITFPLKARALPTCVSSVMAHRDLARTEFFTDFLQRDGLHYGINMYCVAPDGRHVGDVRIWRGRRSEDYDQDACEILSLVRPALTQALMQFADPAPPTPILSPREAEIARHVAAGASDKEIGRMLGLSPTTVRTHIKHLTAKLGVARRSAVGAALSRHRPS